MSEVRVEVSMCVGIGRERGTYTVQVEGVRCAGGVGRSGEGDLDGRVDGELVDTARREEILGSLGTAQDLQEDGDGGGHETRAVDGEPGPVEAEGKVDGLVDAPLGRAAGLEKAFS